MSLEGRTDLHIVANSLTAVRYWAKILRAIVRDVAGVVGPGFIPGAGQCSDLCGYSVGRQLLEDKNHCSLDLNLILHHWDVMYWCI